MSVGACADLFGLGDLTPAISGSISPLHRASLRKKPLFSALPEGAPLYTLIILYLNFLSFQFLCRDKHLLWLCLILSFLLLVRTSELSAGSVYVRSELSSHSCANAKSLKRLRKLLDRIIVRALEVLFTDLIYGYQIDVYRHRGGTRAKL